jgi:chromosome segregation ATPase
MSENKESKKRDTNMELLIHEMQKLNTRITGLEDQQLSLSVDLGNLTTEVEKMNRSSDLQDQHLVLSLEVSNLTTEVEKLTNRLDYLASTLRALERQK